MKERPIIFSGPMIRAILDGRKTQTRRVVKPQPPGDAGIIRTGSFHPATIDKNGEEQPGVLIFGAHDEWGEWGAKHPYGAPGDRLWVREICHISTPRHDGDTGSVEYRADYCDELACGIRWRPSIHMPRWASRITLEVVSVRVERLNEISEEDASAEGARARLSPLESVRLGATGTHREGFSQVWQSINGPGSWDENPFVWVVEFRQV